MLYKSIFVLLLLFSFCSAQLTTQQIIQKIDANEQVESSEGEMQQIITTTDGSERTLTMKMYTKDRNDKQLSIYTDPVRVKGDKILMLDDGNEIWFYTPKTDRVRHLASHARRQKVQGSDFSYEDMASGNLQKKFASTLKGEEEIDGRTCYKLELIPNEHGPSYQKLELWADKERFVTLRIDYYDENGLSKRLLLTDIKNIDGYWYAMTMTMQNLIEGGKTVIKTLDINFKTNPPEKLFSTNYLKVN